MYVRVCMHIHRYSCIFACMCKMNHYVKFITLLWCQTKSFALHVPFSSFVGQLFPTWTRQQVRWGHSIVYLPSLRFNHIYNLWSGSYPPKTSLGGTGEQWEDTNQVNKPPREAVMTCRWRSCRNCFLFSANPTCGVIVRCVFHRGITVMGDVLMMSSCSLQRKDQ